MWKQSPIHEPHGGGGRVQDAGRDNREVEHVPHDLVPVRVEELENVSSLCTSLGQ